MPHSLRHVRQRYVAGRRGLPVAIASHAMQCGGRAALAETRHPTHHRDGLTSSAQDEVDNGNDLTPL